MPGHLHGDNILTDGLECWLTDFHDAGPALQVRDLWSLEALIRYKWTRVEPKDLFSYETMLTADDLSLPDLAKDHVWYRPVSAIKAVRGFIPRGLDPRLYYLGLYFHCLAILLIQDRKRWLMQQEIEHLLHVLVGAGLLVALVEGESLIADAAPRLDGILIEKEGLKIDGKAIPLMPRGYQIMWALFQAKGPISRQDLGTQIWKKYKAENKRDVQRLNTEISRIRKEFRDAGAKDIIVTGHGTYGLEG